MTPAIRSAATSALLVALTAGACGTPSPRDRTPGNATPTAVVAAPVDDHRSGPLPLAAGEALAEAHHDARTDTLWDRPGGGVRLAAITRGDQVVLRAFTAHGAIDVTPAEPEADLGYALRGAATGDAMLFQTFARVGRAPGVGVLLAYTTMRIEAAADGTPRVTQTWRCDEAQAAGGECTPPAWAEAEAEAEQAEACCCKAALIDPVTGATAAYTMMDASACTGKTDDGVCVAASFCAP